LLDVQQRRGIMSAVAGGRFVVGCCPGEEISLGNGGEREPSTLEDVQPLLTDLLSRLRAQFGGELVSVVIYGSYARAEADAGSDIDLLVVVPNLPHEWRDIFAMEDELMRAGLDLGRRVDLRLVEPEGAHAVSWAAPFMLEVYDAHRVLLDTKGFFAAEMRRFEAVMRERGVYKMARGVWRVPSVQPLRVSAFR
jgi:predicted nucleotidyltransferase